MHMHRPGTIDDIILAAYMPGHLYFCSKNVSLIYVHYTVLVSTSTMYWMDYSEYNCNSWTEAHSICTICRRVCKSTPSSAKFCYQVPRTSKYDVLHLL